MKLAYVLLASVALLLAGCGSDDGPSPAPALPRIPTAEGMSAVNLASGIRNDEMLLADSSRWPFRIIVGNIDEGEKVPLVVGLHWLGDAETAYQDYARCLFETGFRDINGIKIALSSEGGIWGDYQIYTFVELAIEHWPIDPERVAVTGYSNGWTSAWNFAHSDVSPFTASIPMAGFYSFFGTSSMPFYVIHGSEDNVFPYQDAIGAVEDEIAAGSEGEFVTAEGLDHFQACQYLSYLRSAADWLEDTAWDSSQ